ncbi:LAFA_0B08284g1_1 [Lachancea sp. 'fantastica']|nr:LAFA_0B08284g1_1 [Lachancea sp. 'fantastica']
MGSKARTCRACESLGLHCDFKKPQCTYCLENNVKCSYPMTLKWGGRPYKDKTKRIKLPPNTKMVGGVLMADFSIQKPAKVKLKKRIEKKLITLENTDNLIESIFESPKTGSSIQLKCAEDAQEGPEFGPLSFESINNNDLDSFLPIIVPPPTRVLKPMHMPGLDLLNKSLQHSDFFEYYVQETALSFVASSKAGDSNPFSTIVPRLALHSPTLMKIVMAFGGMHRDRRQLLLQRKQVFSLDDEFSQVSASERHLEPLIRELEQQGVSELIKELSSSHRILDDLLLASILVLASLYIFFGKGKKWHIHMVGAEGIILQELGPGSRIEQKYLKYSTQKDPHHFLRRWFVYIRIMGYLSAGRFPRTGEQIVSPLRIDFSIADSSNETQLIDDVLSANGMDLKVMSFLAEISSLIVQKETSPTEGIQPTILQKAVELDYKISRRLDLDRVSLLSEGNGSYRPRGHNSAQDQKLLLNAIKLLFEMTGLLQLRRRVLGLTHESLMVRDLLLNMTDMIETKFLAVKYSGACLLFSFFSCGCELIEECLVPRRKTCLAQIDLLIELGVETAIQAKAVMQECWRTSKSWWDVLREQNQDICFAI